MSNSDSLRPTILLCPVRAESDDHRSGVSFGEDVDEVVDKGHAMTSEPIVGTDRVVYDDATGQGL